MWIGKKGQTSFTDGEVRRLQIVLSTFQDGSGWEKGGEMFGFRQFERSLKEVLPGASAEEDKRLFDVVAPRTIDEEARRVGFSCKAKGSLDNKPQHRIYIEAGNARGTYEKALANGGLMSVEDYKANPDATGNVVLGALADLQKKDADDRGLSLQDSSYVVLLYQQKGPEIEMFELPLHPLSGEAMSWQPRAKSIVAKVGTETVAEFFWTAGQIKLYPLASVAKGSIRFELLPRSGKIRTLVDRAADAYPTEWSEALRID